MLHILDIDHIELAPICESDEESESMSNAGSDSEEDEDGYPRIESTLFELGVLGYTFVRRIHVHGRVGVYAGNFQQKQVCIKIVCANKTKRCPIEVHILKLVNNQYPNNIHFPELVVVYQSSTVYVVVTTLLTEDSIASYVFGHPVKISVLLRQLLHIVLLLHSIGIIYRDMKLTNLLWNNTTETLAICDFDLSTFDTEKGHCAVLGTTGYMAPEVTVFEVSPPLSDDPLSPYGKSIDIFGVGVVLGTCLNDVTEACLDNHHVYRWRQDYRQTENRTLLEDLFLKLTDYVPQNRISIQEALLLLQEIDRDSTRTS